MSPFEVVYGFNPITPLDLLPLPQEQVISKDDKARADYVKQLHQHVKENLERRTQQYEKQANKGRKRVSFEVGDWVWVHFRKEHFPAQRSSKLLPRGDGPFQVVAKVNENAYKFEDKSFSRRGDDVSTSSSARVADPEVLPQGHVTRSKAKQFREALSLTCAKLLDSFDNVCALDNRLYNVLHADISFHLNKADTPSASSFQLIEAPFSSTSALLAQLKLNNPEVAETYPMQGRVSYGHVDSMWGVLPFLYACARHVMASGACAMHTGQHVQRMCIITHAKHVAGFKQPFPSCFRRLTLQMSGCQCKPPKREII
ncbi:hypothetical protein GQ457_18G000090 [Hibiscus cannabinus]